jgi:hypothetical protein
MQTFVNHPIYKFLKIIVFLLLFLYRNKMPPSKPPPLQFHNHQLYLKRYKEAKNYEEFSKLQKEVFTFSSCPFVAFFFIALFYPLILLPPLLFFLLHLSFLFLFLFFFLFLHHFLEEEEIIQDKSYSNMLPPSILTLPF